MVEEYRTDFDGGASVKSSTIGGSRLKHHDVERLIRPKAISSIDKFELVIPVSYTHPEPTRPY